MFSTTDGTRIVFFKKIRPNAMYVVPSYRFCSKTTNHFWTKMHQSTALVFSFVLMCFGPKMTGGFSVVACRSNNKNYRFFEKIILVPSVVLNIRRNFVEIFALIPRTNEHKES